MTTKQQIFLIPVVGVCLFCVAILRGEAGEIFLPNLRSTVVVEKPPKPIIDSFLIPAGQKKALVKISNAPQAGDLSQVTLSFKVADFKGKALSGTAAKNYVVGGVMAGGASQEISYDFSANLQGDHQTVTLTVTGASKSGAPVALLPVTISSVDTAANSRFR